jgi:hypothetical protein
VATVKWNGSRHLQDDAHDSCSRPADGLDVAAVDRDMTVAQSHQS